MNKKICYLIDDDPDELDFFTMAIKELNVSLELVYSNNASHAMEALERKEIIPHYIFVDINMPKKNGWECLSLINRLDHLSKVPIAIYSTTLPFLIPVNVDNLKFVKMVRKATTISELKVTLSDYFKSN